MSALAELVARIRSSIGSARAGLPHELFLLVSELTPLVNVDLLVKDERGQTLLTWRHDEFYGPGWHVPGGILRFKEKAETRIAEVARLELGASVRFASEPLLVREVMNPNRDVRGHFISIVYLCALTSAPAERLRQAGAEPRHGEWRWHDKCPHDVIAQHEAYRQLIDRTAPLVGSGRN